MLRSALLLALAAVATPVLADEVLLARPIEAGSVAADGLSLVAYYVALPDDGFAVTATWLGADDAEPSRLTLRLAEGDSASFSLPGHLGTRLTFARDVDAVTVTAVPVEMRDRSASL